MSLRLRLTLIYSGLLVGAILIVSITGYAIVTLLMLNQVDTLLEGAAEDILNAARLNPNGELDIINPFPPSPSESYYIQLWRPDGQLAVSSGSLRRFNEPLDPIGLRSRKTAYRDFRSGQIHLRIVSVPLEVNERSVGVLQIGLSLQVIDRATDALLVVLAASAALSITLAGAIGWAVIGRSLEPLEAATDAALQITQTQDISGRIPLEGTETDEIGSLILAFNQTLARLEQLFHGQRRFLADVSHELRTPLTVIKGNIGLIRRVGADEESLESIDDEVDRLSRLVGDLLLLAQAETGKIPLNLQPIDLDSLLLEVFQQMRVLAGDRLQIHLVEIDQIQIQGDRDRLKQVLLNIGGNAIQYTPLNGKIQISLSREGGQARILFTDTGAGISAEDLPHVFERFYRSQKSRTREKEGGYGLGLSIAYWIVRHHGGHIDVKSKEGQGTTFAIWLPLAPPQPEKPAGHSGRTQPLKESRRKL